MAQVNAQYPNLAQIFGQYSVAPVEYGLQQFESAQNADKLNQQQALQDILFNEQNNPLKLEASRLGNETTAAGLPGIFAQSGLLQDKAAVSRGSLGEQIAGAKGAARAQLSDSDLKILENGAQQMAMSQDPQERAMGEMLLKQHRSVVQESEKQRQMALRQAELERVRGDEARKTQGQAIEAGKYVRGGSGGASDIEAALLSGKMGFEKAATATFAAAQEALARGDEVEAERLMNLANQYNRMRVQDRQAGARATQEGKVDLGAMGGVPVNGPQPVQQFTRPNPGATTPQQKAPSLSEVQAMYPGVPAAKLREAYKKKFGIDIN
jgi:hypothetical protein